ncbi:MAG: FG-GAP-like repeat-containing protein [Limisphaerales bacterium]
MRALLLLAVIGLAPVYAAEVRPLDVPPGRPGFTLLPAADTGLAFTNALPPARYVTNQVHLNGSGVALADVDGDGRCDVFLAALGTGNRLFRNLGGWCFTNITAAAGVALSGLDCTGVAFADLDGEGGPDLVINTIAQGTHLLLNDGAGRFTPMSGPPLNPGRAGMSLALGDADGDGDLDLYVSNYRTETIRDQPNTRLGGRNDEQGRMIVERVNGRPATEPDLVGRFTLSADGRITEHGEPDVLFRNDGGARFTPLSFTDGTFLDEDGKPLRGPPHDWGLSVLFRDLNGDGAPDLYVCNDFGSPDRIWWNASTNGAIRFRAAPRLAFRHTSQFSMGADAADVDRDGHDDLFVADMLSRTHAKRVTQVGDVRPQFNPVGVFSDRPQYSFNTLFRARGDGTFEDIAWYAGVAMSEWSWTPHFLDVDLDGFEDLLLTTGHELEMMDADVAERGEALKSQRPMSVLELLRLRLLFPRLNIPNVAFRNRGDLTFEDTGEAWGFALPAVSHGLATGDLDGDGDLDVVINNLNDGAFVLRNEAPASRLLVRLRGRSPNTAGIGARIRVTGGPVVQTQELIAGGRYLSGDEPTRVFAAGHETNRLDLEVRWRSGLLSLVTNVPANSLLEVSETGAVPPPSPSPPAAPPPPLFTDATERLRHVHADEPFDDFSHQPLLPHRLSQLGPGLAWQDVNGDGLEDLVIGTGRGGRLLLALNDGQGGFKRATQRTMQQPEAGDVLGLLALPLAPGQVSLLAVGAADEHASTKGAALREFQLAAGSVRDLLPADPAASFAVLAATDVEGDGDLDLFLGGRVVPGRHPAAPRSRLLRREGDGWREDPADRPLLENLGPVTSAVWTDLDGDGFSELVVAASWSPLAFFKNEKGRLAAWTPNVTEPPGNRESAIVSPLSLAAGDLDGDGRPDLVCGSWGLNHALARLAAERPARLYHGDLDANGVTDLIEAHFDLAAGDYVPLRPYRALVGALPFLRERFPTHLSLAQATVTTLLGPHAAEVRFNEVGDFRSVALLNRGGSFELRPLPREAQFAPAISPAVADFDGDGHEDVLLSQNFFALHGDAARLDAGRGLLLRGDGRGGFSAVPGQESGVLVYGEQRAAAVADYDGDGRTDVAIAQNGAATRLLRNAGARPGLRVRLAGPPGNPAGLGARLRLESAGRHGPAREISAGSGWLAQHGAVTVLAAPPGGATLHVRWPGGRTGAVPVPAGAKEATAAFPPP